MRKDRDKGVDSGNYLSIKLLGRFDRVIRITEHKPH